MTEQDKPSDEPALPKWLTPLMMSVEDKPSEAKHEVDGNAKWLEKLAAAIHHHEPHEVISPECAGRVLAVRDQLLALTAQRDQLLGLAGRMNSLLRDANYVWCNPPDSVNIPLAATWGLDRIRVIDDLMALSAAIAAAPTTKLTPES